MPLNSSLLLITLQSKVLNTSARGSHLSLKLEKVLRSMSTQRREKEWKELR